MELIDGLAVWVEKPNRAERPPLGLITSMPKLPAAPPRLITIVKEVGVTLSICEPLNVPIFVPEPLKTSTVRLNWKLPPLTCTFWLLFVTCGLDGEIELTNGFGAV